MRRRALSPCELKLPLQEFTCAPHWSALGHCDSDVPVLDPTRVASLNIERSRVGLSTVERTAGDARDLLVVDDRDPFANQGHITPEKHHVEVLPLARLGRQVG